jgi:hypothetical protein
MLGVAFPGIAPTHTPAPPPAQPTPPVAVEPARNNRTMMGVAMPGIAPLQPGASAAPPPQPAPPMGQPVAQSFGQPVAQPVAQPFAQPGGRIGTMVGVAAPGIAPLNPGVASPSQPPHGGMMSQLASTAPAAGPSIVPMPPPFVADEPIPEAPRRKHKKGVPIGVVAAIVGGIVLVGGGLIALLYRGAPPISAHPKLDAQGNEALHLRCASCKDGTVAELNGAKTTFHANEADLGLTKPLDVGDNAIALNVRRPGASHDDVVSLVVPVAFRIRADLSDIGAKPPVITVRVGAAPGAEVNVDGKPLTLDATGHGAYALDVSADTEGLTEELRVIDRKIPYTVALKGAAPESGVVSARVAVVPVRLDSPSSHAVIDGASFVVAGQTQAGGSVTINDQPVTMSPDGTFAQTLAASAPGEVPVDIRAVAPSRAPRTAHLTVKRVASLEAEARAADATPLLGYDAVAADIGAKIGQRVVIAGEVLESRASGHQVIALIDDHHGCAKGPCLARVTAGDDAVKLPRGAAVRAYGRVTRAVTTSNGKTVPEVEADFVVPAAAKGRAPR